MTQRKKTFFVIAALVATGLIACRWLYPTPEQVLADFYAAEDRAEDMLMDPLILHSKRVAPLVIREIRRPEMPRRRYAISFLGQGTVRAALPVLRRILEAPQEQDYFRADALEAIHSIDASEGRRLAADYIASQNLLGKIAEKIVSGTHVPFRRTYWQALAGSHE